jgi:1-acyl-sn-glycerol-3-phosphate acyltransferase
MSWARRRPAIRVREVIICGILGPLMDLYTRRRIRGVERLAGVDPPVLFVANHSSHMDTPAILRALPRRWRRRTAVAAAADYFYRVRWLAGVVTLAFNTVPVKRRDAPAPCAAADLKQLIGDGWSLLIYAEGTRSRDGTVGRLRSGAAHHAAEHGLAIVPINVTGTRAAMPPGRGWMRRTGGRFRGGRHPIAISFGPPVRPRAGEHPIEVMERVRQFFDASGAVTTPDPRIAARRAASRAAAS